MSLSCPRPSIPRGSVRPKVCDWAERNIAYLRAMEYFSRKQIELLETNEKHPLPLSATNHPVIILKKGKPTARGQFYLVCTVSAYSSGPNNNYLPPWDQFVHCRKNPENFRSFAGSEIYRPLDKAPEAGLELKQGQRMPKPKTSWVYTRNAWIVPESVLGPFNKSAYQLEMTERSHADLITHMMRSCSYFEKRLADHRMVGCAETATYPHTPHRKPRSSSRKPRKMVPAIATAPLPLKSAPAPEPATKIVMAVAMTTCSWASVVSTPVISAKVSSSGTKAFKTIQRSMAVVS